MAHDPIDWRATTDADDDDDANDPGELMEPLFRNYLSSDLSAEDFTYVTVAAAEAGFMRLVVAACVQVRNDGLTRDVMAYSGQQVRVSPAYTHAHPAFDQDLQEYLYFDTPLAADHPYQGQTWEAIGNDL